jgi:hypothetical protein
MSDVTDLYEEAIAGLEALSADFKTSDAARDEANARIATLRQKAQDASLEDIAGRTAQLQALASDLGAVLQKTEAAGSPLQAVANKIQKAIIG